jgi:hypothetical protein
LKKLSFFSIYIYYPGVKSIGFHISGCLTELRSVFHKSNCIWYAASCISVFSPPLCRLGHQVSFPFESRFVQSQKPCPSYMSTFIELPRRFRKMNIAPESGSRFNLARQTAASPSIPFLKSTGSMARRILVCGVI